MTNKVRGVLGIIDPLTGLPRAILNKPIPEELVDEHFVYKSSVKDYSDGLMVGDEKYMIDIDENDDED
jgi:hypothetical protein